MSKSIRLLFKSCAEHNGIRKIKAEKFIVETSIKDIMPSEAHDKMLEEDVVIIDVRPIEAYEKGHINGAHSLPLSQLNKETATALVENMDTPVLVYCHQGIASAEAAEILEDIGFTDISDMIGGIRNWTFGLVQ